MRTEFDILVRPLVTEKSTILSEQNKILFEVIPTATKHMIKKAVEKVFKTKVLSVNVINQKGKTKRFKNRLGRRSDVRKAIVTLEKDQSIDVLGGV